MLDATRPGLFAFPFFLLLIAFEAWWLAKRRGVAYPWKDSLASFGVAVGYKLSGLLVPLVALPVYLFAWENRVTTVPLDTAWGIALLVVGVEFFYYWFHRCSHEIRWLWATHAVHHSPMQLNFAAAYRLGWTGLISFNWIFWLPMLALGFHPGAVFLVLGLNLVYQFWLHTEIVPKLGPLEWVLNTPSHHRVHHATNPAYIDRNYGGVVIVFDRLFGTFAEERADDPCRFGLVKPCASRNPFVIAFHEWARMLVDAYRAPTWRARLFALFGRPGAARAGAKPASLSVQAAE
jgi:sterol desaturase/sphingolipid hydroxylase (fatty acid hydroxylase superfamily)